MVNETGFLFPGFGTVSLRRTGRRGRLAAAIRFHRRVLTQQLWQKGGSKLNGCGLLMQFTAR